MIKRPRRRTSNARAVVDRLAHKRHDLPVGTISLAGTPNTDLHVTVGAGYVVGRTTRVTVQQPGGDLTAVAVLPRDETSVTFRFADALVGPTALVVPQQDLGVRSRTGGYLIPGSYPIAE